MIKLSHTHYYETTTNSILTAQLKRKIDAAEMKLLRPLAGYTLYDHMTNEYIQMELGINNILKTTENDRLKSIIIYSEWTKLKLLQYQPIGTIRIG